jgi:hypothetical protein
VGTRAAVGRVDGEAAEFGGVVIQVSFYLMDMMESRGTNLPSVAHL